MRRGASALIVSESDAGVDIYLDLGMIDVKTAERVRGILAGAIGVLEKSRVGALAPRQAPKEPGLQIR